MVFLLPTAKEDAGKAKSAATDKALGKKKWQPFYLKANKGHKGPRDENFCYILYFFIMEIFFSNNHIVLVIL